VKTSSSVGQETDVLQGEEDTVRGAVSSPLEKEAFRILLEMVQKKKTDDSINQEETILDGQVFQAEEAEEYLRYEDIKMENDGKKVAEGGFAKVYK